MANKQPAKQYGFFWNVNDFLGSRDLPILTAEHIGAYIMLLNYAWPDGLEDNDEMNRLRARLSPDAWASFEWFFRKKFVMQKNGRLHNPRLLQEVKRINEKSEIAKNAANTRWNRDADALQTQCKTDADAMPKVSKGKVSKVNLEKPPPPPSVDSPSLFEIVESFQGDYKNQYENKYKKQPPNWTDHELQIIGSLVDERNLDLERLRSLTQAALSGFVKYCPTHPSKYLTGKWLHKLDAVAQRAGPREKSIFDMTDEEIKAAYGDETNERNDDNG